MTFDEWWEHLKSQDKKGTIEGLKIKDDIKEICRATWEIARASDGIEVKDLQERNHDKD
jgi:hypothetical protein